MFNMKALKEHAAMSRKNRRLVADEPVEVEDFRKFTDHLEESMEYTSNI